MQRNNSCSFTVFVSVSNVHVLKVYEIIEEFKKKKKIVDFHRGVMLHAHLLVIVDL